MDERLRQDWRDALSVLAELWEQGMRQPILEAALRRVELAEEAALRAANSENEISPEPATGPERSRRPE